MPRFIIRPEPDRDLYVEWWTVVDAPVGHGTRAEWKAEGIAPAHLDRADRTGTSAYPPLDDGAWDDEALMVAEPLGGQRLLPRDHLVAYTLALYAGRVAAAYGMTRPADDEQEIDYPPAPRERRAVRVHRRRCRICNPAGNPPPLVVDGAAYARRRKHRTRGRRP